MKSKILVIFTGGTIGSASHQGVLRVDEGTKYLLLEKFREKVDFPVDFDTLCPFEILSENMTHVEWQMLCDTVGKVDVKKYLGIIVAHGTDTLSYTAALLSFAFPSLSIPLLLVSSHYPLSDVCENGTDCFGAAVRFILEEGVNGVFAVCHDKKGTVKVHLGTRLLPCDPVHDAFSDFGKEPYGTLEKDGFHLNRDLSLIAPEKLRLGPLSFGAHILVIHAHPNTDYRAFNPLENTRAVIHTLYHSDTASTAEEPYSLRCFIEKCFNRGIEVYLLSQSQKTQNLYQTAADLAKTGAITLRGISLPAAYAKLHVAYAQSTFVPKDFVSMNIAGEFLSD